jgi:cardiolipin synthase
MPSVAQRTGEATAPPQDKESRRWLKPRVPADQLGRLAPPRPKPRRLGKATGAWRRARTLLWSWWLWLLAAAGLLYRDQPIWAAVLTAIAVALYHAVPEFHRVIYALDTHLDPQSSEFRISMEGATGMPLLAGNAVRIYNDGDSFYPAMLEAIEQAQSSITMEQYIFWDGRVGRRFADAMAERSQAGVAVKILVDAIGSSTIGESILRTLEQAGCQLAWFRPIHWYTLDRANRRTHRKSLIIDGRTAFTGGAGIADVWLVAPASGRGWRDVQIGVEGPAALVLQSGFALNWLLTTGELISGETYFPPPVAAGAAPACDIDVQTILSSPGSGASAAGIMVLIAMQSARHSLSIANPYFIPDPRVIAMLAEACARGVHVRIMLSGERCDSWWARQNSVRLYGPLLQAGVELYEYQTAFLHQKTMVVDGAWATVGTTNLDNRSFSLNEEANVCFHHPELVAELEQIFRDDLAACRRITWKQWRHRGAWQRVSELTASILEDQV